MHSPETLDVISQFTAYNVSLCLTYLSGAVAALPNEFSSAQFAQRITRVSRTKLQSSRSRKLRVLSKDRLAGTRERQKSSAIMGVAE